MKFIHTRSHHISSGLPYNCSINAAAILLNKTYEDVYSEMLKGGEITFDGYRNYLTDYGYWYSQILDKDANPLLKLTEEDMPQKLKAYIAIVQLNKNETHATFINSNTIYDKINTTGKKLIGIYYWKEDASILANTWPGLQRVFQSVDDTHVENSEEDQQRKGRAFGVDHNNEFYKIESAKKQIK